VTDQEELERDTGKSMTFSKVFGSEQTFAAYYAAEAFCQEQGFSVGRMQRDAPVGIKRGDWDIQKWRNRADKDRECMDGAIIGEDKRNGPVTVFYSEEE